MRDVITFDYIAGFFDGEGSCIVRFKKDQRYGTGIQVSPWINITSSNRKVLELIRSKFNAGKIYFHKRDKLWHLNIYATDDLLKITSLLLKKTIIKKKKLGRFLKILKLMKNKEHLTPKGLEKIKMLWHPETEANPP